MQTAHLKSCRSAKKAAPLMAALGLSLLIGCAHAEPAPQPAKAPFKYVWGKAYHILPETHSDESGYFSIIEGKDGKIYIGTAKYNHNAYLVEFDPRTEQQKIVIDTHKVVGQTATGYASQAKIHTRNFVGPSGKVYVGSQEGYRAKDDTSEYPGGYVMTYDPKTGVAESLGMPYPGKGVIDVVADEARGLIYVVTTASEKDPSRHWMLYDMKSKQYRDLGPLVPAYATTLMDGKGRANVLTKDYQLAQFDPATGKVTVRDILVGKDKWSGSQPSAPPTWQLAADGNTAYLIMMSDPTLFTIDLYSQGDTVQAESHGKMTENKGFDSRSSLSIAPDGRVYVLGKSNNDTGFGGGTLHHLLRYDPKKRKLEDLGVLAVKNPEFFNFGPRADGTNPPWSHGYHTLPDGTLTPLHGHQGLIVAKDGSLYALILYPYTLLRITGVS